jgi:hypothetical protein
MFELMLSWQWLSTVVLGKPSISEDCVRSSGLKSKPSKYPTEAGDTFLWNTGLSPNYTALQFRNLYV